MFYKNLMREIFAKLPHISIEDDSARRYVLLDTCFFIHVFEHQKEYQHHWSIRR